MIIKIGSMYINTDNITYIIDREVYFNNDRMKVMSEPDLQTILSAIYKEPKQESKLIEAIKETKADLAKPAVKKAKK